MASSGKPQKPESAGECVHCGSDDTERHCPGRQCTWLKCRACNRLTDTRRARKRGS